MLLLALLLVAFVVPRSDVAGRERQASPQPFVSLWVDPAHGDDAREGRTRSTALRTLSEAWRLVPARVPLARAYRILLVRGRYDRDDVPVYWESRWGTRAHPITLVSADGPGAAILP